MLMLSRLVGMGNDVLMCMTRGIYKVFMLGNGVMLMLSRLMGMGSEFRGNGCIVCVLSMVFLMDGDAEI